MTELNISLLPWQEKVCTICEEKKEISEFHKHNTTVGGRRHECKPCFNEITRNAKYRKRYGLTSEEVTQMKKSGCAICEATENLHIDHNHDTDEIRGVLCSSCNRGIGYLGDSPDRLASAEKYLRKVGHYG